MGPAERIKVRAGDTQYGAVMDKWKIKRAEKGLKGEITVPPDKSISHRAVMFGSVSEGKCRIDNFLKGEDCMSTLEALRSCGVEIEMEKTGVVVSGKGLKGLEKPAGNIFLGNSGTTMRVLPGILAGQNFDVVLDGDESLSKRPMKRIIEPLRLMGADIGSMGAENYPPLIIRGGVQLRGVDHVLPMASAQVKSCLLCAGLYAEGITSVREPFQSRDHTERMLEYLGADIIREDRLTTVTGGKKLRSRDMQVPGDISSAAFFMVAALLVEGSDIVLKDVGLNPTRVGIINVLKRMGGDIEILSEKGDIEPSGDVRVKFSPLKAVSVEEREIPLLIDEIPVLCVAASMAEGETVINGIKELKIKETDRVMTVKSNLMNMGAEIRDQADDSLLISGGRDRLKSADTMSFGDHRIAMSMAIASLVADGESSVHGVSCADVSYPGFLDALMAAL